MIYHCLIIIALSFLLPAHECRHVDAWGTVYQLTRSQCDGDPSTGAFGKMGIHPRECALPHDFARRLGVQPGGMVWVRVPDNPAFDGLWVYWDAMPGCGNKIDFQTGGNWSGDVEIVTDPVERLRLMVQGFWREWRRVWGIKFWRTNK